MKILVIHGSMRKGNTYALANEILSRLLVNQDVEIIEFNVADLNLPFCSSCHLCLLKGEQHCPHRAVMEKIQTALAECDGVIFSGAVYMRGLNAAMKNVIDHLAYLFHRPALFGKKGIVVITTAGSGEGSVTKYLKMILGFWGVNGAFIVSKKMRNHNAKPGEALKLSAKEIVKFDKVVSRFYNLIKSKRPIPPSLKSIAIHNTIRAVSLSPYTESKSDAEYWSKDGFCNKAYPVRAGFFKYLIGTLVYSSVKILVKIVGQMYAKK
ncbi:FMN reductase [Fibrobacteria bacterium R8-3-H12]